VKSGKIDNFVALDQDEASLAVIDKDYGRFGIRTMNGSVRQILAGTVRPGEFDFVYAAGLFDYLSAPVATALTRRMFEMTRPGGLRLIPNFLTDVQDTGYMEAFMDWHLIYRSQVDMRALADALPANEVADYQIFNDSSDAVTFLLVSKSPKNRLSE
jgi:extracellular factor (EF) 3-hydroxypalmitic acid methyl ester biosynthesis protein